MKEEEEQMDVKPMSPLLNGYRVTGHLTHPGYMHAGGGASTAKTYYNHNQYNDPNIISLHGNNLAGINIISPEKRLTASLSRTLLLSSWARLMAIPSAADGCTQ